MRLDSRKSLFATTAKDFHLKFLNTSSNIFITTMVEPGVVHPDRLQALCKPTRENFRKHDEFAIKLKAFLPEHTFQNIEQSLNLGALGDDQMVQLFGVAFGKWILSSCQTASPQWTIAMRKSFRYSLNKSKGAVMLSLAFALKPNITPPVDDTGMANLDLPSRRYPDERECAIKLAESVCQIRDVDETLLAEPELKTKLRDSQADLLESAGYDRAAYLRWVDGGEADTKH